MHRTPSHLAVVVSVTCVAALTLRDFAHAQDDTNNPVSLDKTGIRWVLPFAKARATADERKRILMIKPVAFGTEASGGW